MSTVLLWLLIVAALIAATSLFRGDTFNPEERQNPRPAASQELLRNWGKN